MLMRKPKLQFVVALLSGALLSCRSSTLVADDPLNVLEKPYPIGYPSSNPMPNRVVAVLPAGHRAKVKGDGYGKDFKYYEVALPTGETGYLIVGDGRFHVE